MTLIDEMRNLREDIKSGKEIRRRRIQEIKEDLSVFMKDAVQARRENFKALSEEVNQFIVDLKKNVKTTQKENQAKQQGLKDVLAEMRAAFWGKKAKTKKAAEEGGE